MVTKDKEIILQAIKPYLRELHGFVIEDFVDDDENFAFTNDNYDVSLFQMQRRGVYCGHYFFHSRGRAAVKAAKEMLREAFETGNIEVIEGITPLQKLGARWMNKQLGFKSYGVSQTKAGPCELVILTKDEWSQE